MISDDPAEDADNLDDDELLGSYLEGCPPVAASSGKPESSLPDWPSFIVATHSLTLDNRTLAWFQVNHADWRLAIELVLQAWIASHEPSPPEARLHV